MLLIITTELSFTDVEDLLLSIGIELTATMLNETTGKKLVWIKRNPELLLQIQDTITKRDIHTCHITL